jgi:outer membrane receptor protein involved in Fe transport
MRVQYLSFLWGTMLVTALLIGASGIAGAEEKITAAPMTTMQDTGNSGLSKDGPKTADDEQSAKVPVTDVVVKEQKDSEEEPIYSRSTEPESSNATETVTREDIEEMRPRDVYDIIETALGVHMWRQGARVHNFVKSRGDNIGIVLDGVYLSTTEAQRVLGDLPVELIESMKIVRDSTILTMGPLTAFGPGSGAPNQGFIFINTRRGDSRENEATVGYSTFNTQKLVLFHGDQFDDRFNLGLAYAKSKTDGKEDWNNAYDGNSFLANGGYRDQNFSFNTSLYYNDAWREVQRHIKNGVLDSNIWKYDPMDTTVFTMNFAKPWNADNTTAFSYGYTEAQGDLYQYKTTVGNSTVKPQEGADRVNELNLWHTSVLGRNTLKFGVQTIRWYQLSEGSSNAREEESYGYYFSDESRLSDKLTLDGGLRVDQKYIAKGGDKYQDDGGLVKLSDGRWMDNASSVSVGAAYHLNPVYGLSSRIAYNYTPTPEILTTVNNADLPAEKRFKYELGVSAAYNPAFNPSLTAFYYDIKDAKIASGTVRVGADDISIYAAADSIARRGLELGLKGRITDSFSYNAGYTWFSQSNPAEEQKPENQRQDNPENKYSLGLNYRQGGFDVNVSVARVDPYNSYGMIVGDFTTLNISIGKELTESIKLTVYGQNVTDEHYATNNKGFPPGAAWGCLYDVGATYGIEVTMKF